MYDYEATCDEELTFEEGTVLRVLRKDVHSVDDGWWEGEMITDEGKSVIGLFPSLVIQECGPDGEPLSGEVQRTIIFTQIYLASLKIFKNLILNRGKFHALNTN